MVTTASSARTRTFSLITFGVVAAVVVATLLAYPSVAEIARAARRDDLLPSASWFASNLVGLVFSVTGWVIHRRGPHLVGWIMHGIGLSLVVTDVGIFVFVMQGVGRQLSAPVLVAGAVLGFAWIPALLLMTVFLPLVFPTGRLPGRRWGWVAASVPSLRCTPSSSWRWRH